MPETAQKAKPGKPAKRGRLAKSGKPTVAEVWTEVCKNEIDKIVDRRTCNPWGKATVGCRFHRFRQIGETVEGKLGFAIKNFLQATSYPLELESGEVIEIVGNRILHKLIRKGELCGQRVRITFVGREATSAGHYRKVYRAFVSKQSEAAIMKGDKK